MKGPLISIIANFYNREKFIPKLLKSIFAQRYKNWELICVDDCSPGKDSEIIKKIANKEGYTKQVKVIRNKTNLGLSNSRKVGIDFAQGEYLTFIDGDDWFENDTLRIMVDAVLQYNTDLVLINFYRRFPLSIKQKISNICKYNTPILHDEIIQDYYISFFGINKLIVSCCGKLYRTNTVKKSKFKFGKIFMGEDLLFNAHLFPLLKSMVCIDYYGYNWRFGGFTSHTSSAEETKKTLLEFIELYRIKHKLAENINFNQAYSKMNVELKNVLFSNFSSIAKYPTSDFKSQTSKDLISEIININDYHHNISILLENDRYASDIFIKAISQKNIEMIYNICHKNYKLDWKRRIVKRILTLF